MPPRGLTAYFVFAAEVRKEIAAQVAEENNGKANMGKVGKAIGARWNQLTDDEKQRFKDIAAERAKDIKEQAAAAAEAGEGEEGNDENGGAEKEAAAGPPLAPFGLPTSLVKKIACMDPEVDRMSADGKNAMAKATALFIEFLATKALNHAAQSKRKNFKFADIDAVARKDRRMGDMGMSEMFESDPIFAEIYKKAEDENQGRRANKKADAAVEAAQQLKLRPISAFFGKGPAAAAVAVASEEDADGEDAAAAAAAAAEVVAAAAEVVAAAEGEAVPIEIEGDEEDVE